MIAPRAVVSVLLAGVLALGVSGCATTTPGAAPGAALDVSPAPFAIDQDFADPDVLLVDDTYYAYATNSLVANVQYATSSDLDSWEVADTDVFPELPEWADTRKTWAPDVSDRGDGTFLLYFTAADKASGKQCIGVATAPAATGPFVGDPSPLICPIDQGGAIDASSFVDLDGSRWVLWKNDGNCCALDTWLQITPLSADGLTVTGDTTKLIKQTQGWEGDVVEAPVLVRGPDDRYVLFYSANSYADESYAMGFATASTIVGPYVSDPRPLLSTDSTNERYLGPGGQDLVFAPGAGGAGTPSRIVLHSWDPAFVYRGLSVLDLDWIDGRPSVRLPG